MSIYDKIREHVSARDAAIAYGLTFGHGGRAVCPWHKDHHPDLNFYPNGTCYCFACHNGGDAVALVAQIYGLPMKEAAEKINADFHLGIEPEERIRQYGPSKLQLQREKEARDRKRWGELCDTVRECAAKLKQYPAEKAWDKEFIMLMKVMTRASDELDVMWDQT